MSSSLSAMGGGNGGITPDMLSKLDNLECIECKGVLFESVFRIKRIPAFMIGQNQDAYAQVPVVVCRSCDTVVKQLDPDAVNLSM